VEQLTTETNSPRYNFQRLTHWLCIAKGTHNLTVLTESVFRELLNSVESMITAVFLRLSELTLRVHLRSVISSHRQHRRESEPVMMETLSEETDINAK
jgi:hypothetical protein